MIIDGRLVCEPCGGTSFKPTKFSNVKGLGANLVECRACGVRCYDKAIMSCEDAHDNAATHELAENTVRCGAMDNLNPARTDEFRRVHAAYYAMMLTVIKKHTGWLGQLYEVGAGVGEFLSAAKPLVHWVGGCEINRRAVALAWETHGIWVERCLFQQAKVPEHVDALVMLDVIEHTGTPGSDLKKAARHLRPDGVLVLKTFYDEFHDTHPPNVTTYDPDPAHFAGYLDPVQHVHHFTTAALLGVVERSGFSVIETDVDQIWGQVTVYARRS